MALQTFEGTAGRLPVIPGSETGENQETGENALSDNKKRNKILMGAGAVLLATAVFASGYFALKGGEANNPGASAVEPGPNGDGDINGATIDNSNGSTTSAQNESEIPVDDWEQIRAAIITENKSVGFNEMSESEKDAFIGGIVDRFAGDNMTPALSEDEMNRALFTLNYYVPADQRKDVQFYKAPLYDGGMNLWNVSFSGAGDAGARSAAAEAEDKYGKMGLKSFIEGGDARCSVYNLISRSYQIYDDCEYPYPNL